MPTMAIIHNVVEEAKFNQAAHLPYQLRLHDFQMAMQDVYDFFYDVNAHLAKKGLQRLDDMLRPAIMSGVEPYPSGCGWYRPCMFGMSPRNATMWRTPASQ